MKPKTILAVLGAPRTSATSLLPRWCAALPAILAAARRLFQPSAFRFSGFFLALALLAGGCARNDVTDQTVLRVGYFPNVTHAQGVIGSTLTREDKGWFEQRLGEGVKVEWTFYNAGPSAMEALVTGAIDMTYVGPNPALNLYFRSRGGEVRVVAGAASGGAALLVHPAANIGAPADFRGKTIATPQFGNTQDIAARVWLKKQGFRITQSGGDVSVVPTANPDQLTLFSQGKLDAVWTVEPWVSRIEREAGGRVFLEQGDAVTTVLVASVPALKHKRPLVEKFLQGHRELTAWINANPAEARALLQRGIGEAVLGKRGADKAELQKRIPIELIQDAWKRLRFTAEAKRQPFEELVAQARDLKFIRDKTTTLDRLFETGLDK